jgi:hypothetical protein
MNAHQKLSHNEIVELAERIGRGEGYTRRCSRIRCQWFNIALSNGTRCVGSTRDDSDNAEYERLTVRRAQ